MQEIYLDNNASTRPLPAVREAVLHAMTELAANASSSHSAGFRVRSAIEEARDAVAELLGVQSEQVIFTSGGTEANNLALNTVLHEDCPRRLVISEIEHSSVLKAADFLESLGVSVERLSVDANGLVNPDVLAEALNEPTGLVSIQWVNNETGVVQDIERLAATCRARGVPFHTDAAQAVGKLPIELSTLPIDFLTIAGHKFHAPPGVGALYVRDPDSVTPLVHGGGQEAGKRAGTENVPGITGLGTAARLRRQHLAETCRRLEQLRDRFQSRLLESCPDAVVNGGGTQRVCNTSNIRFVGIDGQALIARLDDRGVRCSQSSACTNQRPEPSYVLSAMGLSESDAYASVRFSIAEDNTAAELDQAAEIIAEEVQSLVAVYRKFGLAG